MPNPDIDVQGWADDVGDGRRMRMPEPDIREV